MKDTLVRTLKQLRVSGLLESLEVRLHEAHSHSLSHAEFLTRTSWPFAPTVRCSDGSRRRCSAS
jgi:hypothetical protein